jgi:hypothetical protein
MKYRITSEGLRERSELTRGLLIVDGAAPPPPSLFFSMKMPIDLKEIVLLHQFLIKY